MPRHLKHRAVLSVFATIYLAILVWLVGSTAGGLALNAWLRLTGQGSSAGAAATDDGVLPSSAFIVLAIVMQLTFITGTVLLVWVLRSYRAREPGSPGSVSEALRLGAPRFKLWVWPLLIGSNIFLWWATSAFFTWVITTPGEHLENLGEQVLAVDSFAIGALTLLAVGILPGVGEEFIFRGFMLRRLQGALPGWAAVLLVSLLFAASHVDPRQALLILPLGLWWTTVSYRAGSIWPGIILHAMNNSWTLLVTWFVSESEAARSIPDVAVYAILAVTAACLVGSVIALCGPGIKKAVPPVAQPN